jgi:hypothetical protein
MHKYGRWGICPARLVLGNHALTTPDFFAESLLWQALSEARRKN